MQDEIMFSPFYGWKIGQEDLAEEQMDKINGSGYEEMMTGKFIPEEDAAEYAIEQVKSIPELTQEFVEWFYSGNFIRRD